MERNISGARFLIVEDDTALAREMADLLEEKGYSASIAEDAPQARAAGWVDIDLVLLDLELPGVSGRVLCREIADTSAAGIIVVSCYSDLVDRVSLLEMGADDFIAKPFEVAELLARIRAVLRRRGSASSIGTVENFGPWHFPRNARQLVHACGRVIALTPSEAKVLRHLADNPGLVFSREELLAVSRARQHAGAGDRSVDNLIKRLRRKLEPTGDEPRFIQSVWGRGYVFQAD
jgi:DNA-binding response OmpR family regulator